MKASARVNANIALVKYWGKKNNQLIIPMNNSISMTTDGLHATTTVEFDEGLKKDNFELNETSYNKGTEYTNLVSFLDVVRMKAGKEMHAKVVSKTNFLTAAGLASSAAGYAALAKACNEALNLNLNDKELSMLARHGSGSASRSIFGGFVEWFKGEKEDGSDSYAEQLYNKEHWPDFRMIACITSKEAKQIKSRAGMKQTVETSPFYHAWIDSVEADLNAMRKGLKEKDFSLVGKTAEYNCLKMHATMITTKPSIIYWNAATMGLLHSIPKWREQGLECYFTMDAGPQVKIICLEKDVEEIIDNCKTLPGVVDFIVTAPGEGAKIIDKHLF